MAKTKALISFAVTAKLICVFVFAYSKSRFSHDAAHMSKYNKHTTKSDIVGIREWTKVDSPLLYVYIYNIFVFSL